GGIWNASTNEIIFAQYNAAQTKVLNLTQMMALAFRGPNAISYDAWERGMARAATMVTVKEVLPLLEGLYGAGTIDVADPLWPVPLRPDKETDDDFAMGVVLVYYRSVIDTGGNSDEVNLSGTSYPIYWDFEFQNRLFLVAQYERVDIRDGLGTVAPTFFNTIG